MVGESNKVVIVTGGSSGIGQCTASALKENGCIVYEFSRRSIPMEGVTHLSVDVTDEDAVNAAVQQVIQKETKIDAVINCAGFGISGAVEFTSMEQAKAQFDVNFFGTVTVNKAVLPFMRHQGKGHIVNISSVAAVAHIPFQTFYSASKAAVSSYSYALANEVKPYGIHVTVVELGDICTGFTKARQKSILGDDEYGGRISHSVSQMEHDEQNGMDPARIGRYIAGIVEKKNPAVVYKFFVCGQRATLVAADQLSPVRLVRILCIVRAAFQAGSNRLAFVFVQRNQPCCRQHHHPLCNKNAARRRHQDYLDIFS